MARQSRKRRTKPATAPKVHPRDENWRLSGVVIAGPGGESAEWLSLREPLEKALHAGFLTGEQYTKLFVALMCAVSHPQFLESRQRLQAACRLWDTGDPENQAAAKRMVGFTREDGLGRPPGPEHREVLRALNSLTSGQAGPSFVFGHDEDETNRTGRVGRGLRIEPGKALTWTEALEVMRSGWKLPGIPRVKKMIVDARAELKKSSDLADRELVERSYQRRPR